MVSLRSMFITTVMFIFIVLGASHFYINMMDAYGVDIDPKISSGLDAINSTVFDSGDTSINILAKNIDEKVEGGESKSDSFVTLLGTNIWESLKLLANFPIIFVHLFTNVTSVLGVPAWVSSIIILIVFILVILAIVSAVARWKV